MEWALRKEEETLREEKQSLPPRLVRSKVSCPLPQAIVVIQREHSRNLYVYEVF